MIIKRLPVYYNSLMIYAYKDQLVKLNEKCRYDDAAGETPFSKNFLRIE